MHTPLHPPGPRVDAEPARLRVLCAAVERCARNLEAIDRLRPPWTRSPGSTADKAEMLLALAAIGLEGLAGESAVDMYRTVRQRRLCAA